MEVHSTLASAFVYQGRLAASETIFLSLNILSVGMTNNLPKVLKGRLWAILSRASEL